MLKALRSHPLLRGIVEVVADATLYVAALLVVLVLLAHLARLAAAAP